MLILFILLALPGCQPISITATQAPLSQATTVLTETPTSTPAATLTPTVPAAIFDLPQDTVTLPRGSATINNAWTGYDTSGFRFDNASVVSWASKQADVLASSRDQSSRAIWFFIPNDSPPFQSRYDKGANSGIIEMPQTNLEAVSECPQDGYQFHWIEAKVEAVYCVRTRDGRHYAALQVTQNQDNLVFDWVYLSAAAAPVAAEPASLTPSPVTYTSVDQDNLTLFPIVGRNVVLLVPSADLDQTVLKQMVDTFDRAYDFYSYSTGRQPQLYLNYQGKATIAVVPSTCGAGCGYLGMTGIELQNDYFEKLYTGVLQYNQYDQPIFYELGRNFWFYEHKIEYKGDDNTGSIATGYAVFMRFMAMEAAGVTPAPYNNMDFARFRAEVEGLLPVYWQYASLDWDNTLRLGKAPPNSMELGGSDLFASILFDLRERYGDPILQWIWKEVDLRPDAEITQDAVDNFVMAACAATEKNLTGLFANRYRWPVSSAAVKEAINRFGDAIQP